MSLSIGYSFISDNIDLIIVNNHMVELPSYTQRHTLSLRKILLICLASFMSGSVLLSVYYLSRIKNEVPRCEGAIFLGGGGANMLIC